MMTVVVAGLYHHCEVMIESMDWYCHSSAVVVVVVDVVDVVVVE